MKSLFFSSLILLRLITKMGDLDSIREIAICFDNFKNNLLKCKLNFNVSLNTEQDNYKIFIS